MKTGRKQMKPQVAVLFNRINLLFVLSLFPVQAESDVLDQQFGQTVFTDDRAERNENFGTPEQRAEMIRRLRLKLNDESINSRTGAERGLLRLGDEQSIASMMPAYRAGDLEAVSNFELAGRASLLPFLIEDVQHGSMQWDKGEVTRGPLKIRATMMALHCIEMTQGFLPETKAWAAERHLQLGEYTIDVIDQVSNQFLRWWDHNKQVVIAGRYAKATWLPTEKINLDFLEKRRNAVLRPPPTPPPALRALPSHASPGSLSAIRRPPIWPWIVAGLFILAGGFMVWRKRT